MTGILGFFGAKGRGSIPGLTKAPRGAPGEWFRDTLTEAQVMNATTVGVAGTTMSLGEFTVPAQQEIVFGFGDPAQPANQGYIFADIQTAVPGQIEGTLALVVTDANNRQRRVVWSMRTEELRGSLTDKNEKEPLPRVPVVAREDDRMVLELTFDDALTATQADSQVLIPISRRYVGSV